MKIKLKFLQSDKNIHADVKAVFFFYGFIFCIHRIFLYDADKSFSKDSYQVTELLTGAHITSGQVTLLKTVKAAKKEAIEYITNANRNKVVETILNFIHTKGILNNYEETFKALPKRSIKIL